MLARFSLPSLLSFARFLVPRPLNTQRTNRPRAEAPRGAPAAEAPPAAGQDGHDQGPRGGSAQPAAHSGLRDGVGGQRGSAPAAERPGRRHNRSVRVVVVVVVVVVVATTLLLLCLLRPNPPVQLCTLSIRVHTQLTSSLAQQQQAHR